MAAASGGDARGQKSVLGFTQSQDLKPKATGQPEQANQTQQAAPLPEIGHEVHWPEARAG